MSNSSNPWLRRPSNSESAASPAPPAPLETSPPNWGALAPTAPQPGVAVPEHADRLPRIERAMQASSWLLGVHGGAGESTLETLIVGSRAAGHAWPMPAQRGLVNRVLLLARTNDRGLTAAQLALTEWASQSLGDVIQLQGIVFIADAPGRLPKQLRDRMEIIGGGAPRRWTIPWVEQWRSEPASVASSPREVDRIISDLSLTPWSTPAHP